MAPGLHKPREPWPAGPMAPGPGGPWGPLAQGAPWPLVLWPCAQRPWCPQRVLGHMGLGARGTWGDAWGGLLFGLLFLFKRKIILFFE